jgi:hypothetical protein
MSGTITAMTLVYIFETLLQAPGGAGIARVIPLNVLIITRPSSQITPAIGSSTFLV